MNEQNISKRKLLIIAVLSTIFVVFVIFLITQARKGSGDGGEYVAPDSPAFMAYKDKAYLPTGNPTMDNMLRADMAFFARKSFPVYDPTKQPSVLFDVTETPSFKEATYHFSGKYQKVGDAIDITFTVLKNDRIKVSITDKKTAVNIDSQLLSNSKINTFIGTLPVFTKDYRVAYALDTEKITVTIYGDYSDAKKVTALKAVSDALGSDYVTDEHLDLYYNAPAAEQVAATQTVVKGTVK
jgi:hypothetical protein